MSPEQILRKEVDELRLMYNTEAFYYDPVTSILVLNMLHFTKHTLMGYPRESKTTYSPFNYKNKKVIAYWD